jgi:hypothetical protein
MVRGSQGVQSVANENLVVSTCGIHSPHRHLAPEGKSAATRWNYLERLEAGVGIGPSGLEFLRFLKPCIQQLGNYSTTFRPVPLTFPPRFPY